MGEFAYKVKELFKSFLVDDHRSVLGVEKNAVLVVVNVRGVLEAPWLAADIYRDNSVVLACRVIEAARIAHILGTQQALGIAALLGVLCGIYCLSGFERLMVISSSPYSVSVFHFISFAMR